MSKRTIALALLLAPASLCLASCKLPSQETWAQVRERGLLPVVFRSTRGDTPPPPPSSPSAPSGPNATSAKLAARPAAGSPHPTSRSRSPEARPELARPGFVYSPFTDPPRLVDVRTALPGDRMKCPYTGEVFFVPSLLAARAENAGAIQAIPGTRPVASPSPSPSPGPSPSPSPAPSPAPSATLSPPPPPASIPPTSSIAGLAPPIIEASPPRILGASGTGRDPLDIASTLPPSIPRQDQAAVATAKPDPEKPAPVPSEEASPTENLSPMPEEPAPSPDQDQPAPSPMTEGDTPTDPPAGEMPSSPPADEATGEPAPDDATMPGDAAPAEEGGPMPAPAEAEAERPATTPDPIPLGRRIANRPGFVNSPHAAPHQIVDVTGLPAGMEVTCPYSGKLFRVPPAGTEEEEADAGAPDQAAPDQSE